MLTDDEINALCPDTWSDWKSNARAIESAVLAKLAGVSVEPVAFAAQNSRNRKFEYIWHEEDDTKDWIWLQHQSRDDVTYRMVKLFNSDQLQTAIAAARVQENERLACEFEGLYIMGGDDISSNIRALIGGST